MKQSDKYLKIVGEAEGTFLSIYLLGEAEGTFLSIYLLRPIKQKPPVSPKLIERLLHPRLPSPVSRLASHI
jgi:hypothetical protein